MPQPSPNLTTAHPTYRRVDRPTHAQRREWGMTLDATPEARQRHVARIKAHIADYPGRSLSYTLGGAS